MKFLLVIIGGGIGALVRFLISLNISLIAPKFLKSQFIEFPIGTLLVNVIASFILGFILGIDFSKNISIEAKLLIGTGFCGGLSTFSTFAMESINLLRQKYYFLLILNILLNNIFTLLFAIFGYLLGKLLTRNL